MHLKKPLLDRNNQENDETMLQNNGKIRNKLQNVASYSDERNAPADLIGIYYVQRRVL